MHSLGAWTAAVFAADPAALGGLALRCAPGPRRDAFVAALRARLPAGRPWLRLPLHVDDDRLLGGLDLAATLAAGRPVAQRGLLAQADGGVIVAAMAERIPPALAGRLALALDRGELCGARDGAGSPEAAAFGLLLLDEGVEDDERPPGSLLERLGLRLDLETAEAVDTPALPPVPPVRGGHCDWGAVALGPQHLQGLVGAAAALGVGSARAALHALVAARIIAALQGRDRVQDEDAALAVQLVLAPRATQLPVPPAEPDAEAAPPESEPPTAPPPDDAPADDPATLPDGPLDDRLVAAALAALPPALLERLRAALPAGPRGGSGGRRGEWTRARQRGRVVGTRAGDPRDGARLHLLATLRAAAPWQRLRRATRPDLAARPLVVQRDDLRVARLRQRRTTTTLFVIDASGSAALHRLAEAKGAVELLLADCYARRDRVAVLAFRGSGAELLLAPTRSLVRARRALAGLPGGGGTPLAAGIEAARGVAEGVVRGGGTPLVVLLTDGRANIAADGSPGRARALQDALAAARRLSAQGAASLLIDTAPQPSEPARAVASAMQARYVALPHADAQAMAGVVGGVRAGLAGGPRRG
ncbi:MAG: magnesium chelatase subunit D [Rubrivivax sp.]|nr:magnesium chelatase subunit D [Rubrivivax sp.]MCA3258648.1 magnesium chelatase subunit D [Rubrivivax sp.]MCZ8030223.1 magnesium chelatase subunit D [Rubrivivax sp.]